jgi:hypothetical protein
MKDHYSKSEAIRIIERALTEKDRSDGQTADRLELHDVEEMAADFSLSPEEVRRAAVYTDARERNRDRLYPEVVTSRWIEGALSEEAIEQVFSEIKLELGGLEMSRGQASHIRKMGKTWECQLDQAAIFLTQMGAGYRLRVIQRQFYHGNNLEAAILAVPLSILTGVFPVLAANEWAHPVAAILTAALFFLLNFRLVKKYTLKKRSETVNKLIQLTDYIESLLHDRTQK